MVIKTAVATPALQTMPTQPRPLFPIPPLSSPSPLILEPAVASLIPIRPLFPFNPTRRPPFLPVSPSPSSPAAPTLGRPPLATQGWVQRGGHLGHPWPSHPWRQATLGHPWRPPSATLARACAAAGLAPGLAPHERETVFLYSITRVAGLAPRLVPRMNPARARRPPPSTSRARACATRTGPTRGTRTGLRNLAQSRFP